jgi:hypothetical protein
MLKCTTLAQERALSWQTGETLWAAPIGHAPTGWVPPAGRGLLRDGGLPGHSPGRDPSNVLLVP